MVLLTRGALCYKRTGALGHVWSTLHPSYHGALPGIYTVKSILLKTMLIWHTFLLTVTSVLSTTHIGVYSNLLVFLTSL